jgi:CHAD domain-containing protein
MKMKWKDDLTVQDNVHAKLPRLAKEFFRAGRKATSEGRSWKQLHKFRLAAKEFRYTLELFAPLYSQDFEERLESLRKLQRYLGEMNDCVAALKLLKKIDGPARVMTQLKRRRDSRLREFRRYWKKFDGGREEDSWTTYLAKGEGA